MTTIPTTGRPGPAKLSFRDGQVMVTPEDHDVFFISAQRATEACREAVRENQRVEQFKDEFLIPLHDWCKVHADKVHACYLPRPAGSIRIFIVTGSPRYDYALGEEVAALELRLARAGWRVEIAQLPQAEGDSLATFFNPDGALEVYAQRGPTPA